MSAAASADALLPADVFGLPPPGPVKTYCQAAQQAAVCFISFSCSSYLLEEQADPS